MNLDFPTILVAATFLTGGVWGLDALLWAPKRRAQATAGGEAAGEGAEEAATAKTPYLVELSRSFFPVILVVLLVRSFLVEPFRIPSGSMMPTLLVGDFILVNKFAYGLRLPVLNTKIVDLGSPKRGDVVVFRYPEDPRIDYIKRIVGVPGDTIAYRDKVLYVNGAAAAQQYVGSYIGEGAGAIMTGAAMRHEDLVGVKHDILLLPQGYDREFEFAVPPGQYFAMGDNRDNSRDSRFWGTVPDANLVGKAFLIWMNWDATANSVAWGRIGTSVK